MFIFNSDPDPFVTSKPVTLIDTAAPPDATNVTVADEVIDTDCGPCVVVAGILGWTPVIKRPNLSHHGIIFVLFDAVVEIAIG